MMLQNSEYTIDAEETYEEYPITNFDKNNSLFTIETDHFSTFIVSGIRFTKMSSNLLEINGKVDARLNLYSTRNGVNVGLDRVRTLIAWVDDGMYDARDILN